MLPKDKE